MTRGRHYAPVAVVPCALANDLRSAVTLPVLPALQKALEASAGGNLAFLVKGRGRPFTAETFDNWFRDRCDEAGVPRSVLGLRKTTAARAAKNGATAHQLDGNVRLAQPRRSTAVYEGRGAREVGERGCGTFEAPGEQGANMIFTTRI